MWPTFGSFVFPVMCGCVFRARTTKTRIPVNITSSFTSSFLTAQYPTVIILNMTVMNAGNHFFSSKHSPPLPPTNPDNGPLFPSVAIRNSSLELPHFTRRKSSDDTHFCHPYQRCLFLHYSDTQTTLVAPPTAVTSISYLTAAPHKAKPTNQHDDDTRIFCHSTQDHCSCPSSCHDKSISSSNCRGMDESNTCRSSHGKVGAPCRRLLLIHFLFFRLLTFVCHFVSFFSPTELLLSPLLLYMPCENLRLCRTQGE